MGQFKELFREYMATEEGREFFKVMMREVLVDVLSSQKLEQNDKKSNS